MHALQLIFVVILVCASLVYTVWRLSPIDFKLRVLDALAPLAVYPGGRWLAKMQQTALAQREGGCGNCAANHTPRKPPN